MTGSDSDTESVIAKDRNGKKKKKRGKEEKKKQSKKLYVHVRKKKEAIQEKE